jgi:branched-chain amino acid transport system ATP-binding protein
MLGSEKDMLQGVRVSRRFGGLKALTDFNFLVEKGQIVGLIGPNGSGKTTLFNVITGFYPADSGKVFYKGKEITRHKPYEIAKLGVARTFQIVRPLLGLSVLDNVTTAVLYGRENIASMVKGRRRALELLKFVRLDEKMDVHAQSLVAGERKRLELARALAIKPELLLLDETFSGLNDTEVAEAIKLIFKIRNEMGVTIFLIEHVMKAVMGTCEKIFVMHYGMRLAEGSPEEVSKNPVVIEAYLGKKKHA